MYCSVQTLWFSGPGPCEWRLLWCRVGASGVIPPVQRHGSVTSRAVVTPDPLQRAATTHVIDNGTWRSAQDWGRQPGTYLYCLDRLPERCQDPAQEFPAIGGPAHLLSAQFFEVGGAVVIDGTWTVRYPSIDLHLHPCYGIRQLSPPKVPLHPQRRHPSANPVHCQPLRRPTPYSHNGMLIIFFLDVEQKLRHIVCLVGLLLCTTVYSRVPGLDCLSHPTLYTQAN